MATSRRRLKGVSVESGLRINVSAVSYKHFHDRNLSGERGGLQSRPKKAGRHVHIGSELEKKSYCILPAIVCRCLQGAAVSTGPCPSPLTDESVPRWVDNLFKHFARLGLCVRPGQRFCDSSRMKPAQFDRLVKGVDNLNIVLPYIGAVFQEELHHFLMALRSRRLQRCPIKSVCASVHRERGDGGTAEVV